MALREDATLSEMAWELDLRLSEIQEVVKQAERNQMHANARIRRELAGLAVMVAVVIIAVFMMWGGVEWRWWFLLAGLIVPWWLAIESARAMKDEEPPS
jgi:Flp pilus assembly protein TadB